MIKRFLNFIEIKKNTIHCLNSFFSLNPHITYICNKYIRNASIYIFYPSPIFTCPNFDIFYVCVFFFVLNRTARFVSTHTYGLLFFFFYRHCRLSHRRRRTRHSHPIYNIFLLRCIWNACTFSYYFAQDITLLYVCVCVSHMPAYKI